MYVYQSKALYARRVTAPAVEPITLSEAKEHLRVIGNEEDGYIDNLITAARQLCEAEIDRSFITTGWQVKVDEFPRDELVLPWPSLIAVSSIAYVDGSEATQALAADGYTVDTTTIPGRIVPAYGAIWPSTLSHINAATINYTSGYGPTAADVPRSIKQAILLVIANFFEIREPVNVGNIVNEIPMSARALLDSERWILK